MSVFDEALKVHDAIASSDHGISSPMRRGKNQADLLAGLIDLHSVELLRDSYDAYVRVNAAGGVCPLYAVRSGEMRRWLRAAFFETECRGVSHQAITDAIDMIEARIIHGSESHQVEVALRVAGDDAMIDIDLGDEEWQMVRVTREGWAVLSHAEGDQYFRRGPKMLALPQPVPSGKLDELRDFIRVDDDGYALIVAWIINALRPRGPYPILTLGGEHGAAKTTTARFLRGLIDPYKPDLRGECRDDRDLAIAAKHSHVIALDNISHISPQMSDALCRLSTGGGFGTRQLYTDDEEVLFSATRPIIITSIVDIASRPDLLDRCLNVRLAPIPDNERRTEESLWNAYLASRSRILGSLLDAVSLALRRLPDVRGLTHTMPRMADAFVWTLAAEPALGISPSRIEQAWNRTREEAHASTIESSPVAAPLRTLVERSGSWCGTATELRATLEEITADSVLRRREWPKSAKALAGHVRTIAPALRAAGIDHQELRQSHSGQRLHRFVHTQTGRNDASPPSPASSEPRGTANSGDAADGAIAHIRHLAGASVGQAGTHDMLGDEGDGRKRTISSDIDDDVEFIP